MPKHQVAKVAGAVGHELSPCWELRVHKQALGQDHAKDVVLKVVPSMHVVLHHLKTSQYSLQDVHV